MISGPQPMSEALYNVAKRLTAIRARGSAEDGQAWQVQCKAYFASEEVANALQKSGLPSSLFSMWRLLGLGVWLGPLQELEYQELPEGIQFDAGAADLGFSWALRLAHRDEFTDAFERVRPALLAVAGHVDESFLRDGFGFWEVARRSLRTLTFVHHVEALAPPARRDVIQAVCDMVLDDRLRGPEVPRMRA